MSDNYGESPSGSSSSGSGNNLPDYGQRIEDAGSQQPSYDRSQPQYGQSQQDQPHYGQQYGDQGYNQQGGGYPTHYQNDSTQQAYPAQQYDNQHYYPGNDQKPAGRGLGIASLVLGIVGLLTFWLLGFGGLLGLIGLILGIISLRQLRKVPGASKALPIVGIILSTLALIAGVITAVVTFWAIGLVGDCASFLDSNDQAGYQQCVEDKVNQELNV